MFVFDTEVFKLLQTGTLRLHTFIDDSLLTASRYRVTVIDLAHYVQYKHDSQKQYQMFAPNLGFLDQCIVITKTQL